MRLKRRVFVEQYLRCWNATEAARLAAYKHPERQGSRLLTFVEVQELIAARVAALKITADEVLLRLADQAQGSMEHFLTVGEEGVVAGLDLGRAAKEGKLHLIKRVTFGDKSNSLELYDAQAALVKLGEAHGLFAHKLDISSGGQPIAIREVIVNLSHEQPDAEPVEG